MKWFAKPMQIATGSSTRTLLFSPAYQAQQMPYSSMAAAALPAVSLVAQS